MNNNNSNILIQTQEFWDSNPCDGHNEFKRRIEYRFNKEPWLMPLLDEIAQHKNILEIGCGQGTDALYCCQHLKQGSSYIAIDLSPKSIENANFAAEETKSTLKVKPIFHIANTEQLEFDDNTFDCVISIGVLHHTPNIEKALEEIYRVLKKDGIAIIALYRLFSFKLLAAHSIRFLLNTINLKKTVMNKLKKTGSNHFLGTMLLECAGVPILRSYTKRELERKFYKFNKIHIKPIGIGFRIFGLNKLIDNKLEWFGAMLLVRAFK